MILALDLGSKTGWAAKLGDGRIDSGVADFSPRPREGSGMRYLRMQRWLVAIAASQGRVEGVYFEQVHRHVGTSAAHVYGGLAAVLTAWCEQHGIPYTGIGVNVWKKRLGVAGNATKEQVREEIRSRGFGLLDFNEADALGVLLYVLPPGTCAAHGASSPSPALTPARVAGARSARAANQEA